MRDTWVDKYGDLHQFGFSVCISFYDMVILASSILLDHISQDIIASWLFLTGWFKSSVYNVC